jgi:cytochrome c
MPPSASVLLAAAVVALGAAAAHAQDVPKGSDVFQDHCSQCHVLSGIGQGPNLIGVVGRKAASLPDYPYSAALRASGLTWTAASLDAFVQGPGKLVPGTAMRAIVPDPTDRQNLIAYLATLHR